MSLFGTNIQVPIAICLNWCTVAKVMKRMTLQFLACQQFIHFHLKENANNVSINGLYLKFVILNYGVLK